MGQLELPFSEPDAEAVEWVVLARQPGAAAKQALVAELARALGLHPIVAKVLVNRGCRSLEEARTFLEPTLDRLHDPMLMLGMEQALERILRAIRAREEILVHGDYDVDGVGATALLRTMLERLGARVRTYIPHRLEEGYGLSLRCVREAAGQGVSLLITVDCGVRDEEQIAEALRLGMAVVVTDHHLPGDHLPPAHAVLCPKWHQCRYPFQDLAGVGVVYKLAQALSLAAGAGDLRDSKEFLDLVALGTVADSVPLLDENRILVTEGLAALGETARPGLRALMDLADVEPPVTTRDIGFRLGPRLNAAGRLEHAQTALDLLLCADAASARDLAAKLHAANNARRHHQERVLREAWFQCENERDLEREKVVTLWGAGWHEGVIGVVAARVSERTGRPAVLISIRGDAARGSARSIGNFDIVAALSHCDDLLRQYGGHAMAAGLQLNPLHLEQLRERLNAVADKTLTPADLRPSLTVDAELSPSEVTMELAEQLQRLGPFGEANPEPLFCSGPLFIRDMRRMGSDRTHLAFQAAENREGPWMDCVGFGLGQLGEALEQAGRASLCFTVGVDTWNGLRRVRLFVRDAKPCPAVGGVCLRHDLR